MISKALDKTRVFFILIFAINLIKSFTKYLCCDPSLPCLTNRGLLKQRYIHLGEVDPMRGYNIRYCGEL